MSFLKNLFSPEAAKASWDRYIADKRNSRSLILVINTFFIRDKISDQKFDTNFTIIEMLTNGHMKFEVEDLKLVGTPVFEQYFNSNIWMTKMGMGVQNWFIAAYADAYIWFQKNYATYQDEAERIFEANQVDDAIPHAFYRFIIDTYLAQGFKLECANHPQ